MLHVYLFGNLRVDVDGTPLTLRVPPKTIPMWGYLLLHRDQPVPRDSLAYRLWPDESEIEARTSLRRHIYQLQHALPAGEPDHPWLLLGHDTVQWNPDSPFWLDLAEFERLLASDQTLDVAVDLYRGDLLENNYDDWLYYDRERLRDAYIAALTRLIFQCRAVRDYPHGLDYVRRLLALDPLHEGAVRQLMTLRYEAGDRNGALRHYKQFVRRLREELAVDPMPETKALSESIVRSARLAGMAHLEPDAGARPHRPIGLLLPFVGRESELERLRTWWSRAARGHGGVVLVGGEAGIGKSRLAVELAAIAEAEGARILQGGTTFSEPAPYQAVAEALRSALALVVVLPIDAIWLSAVASLIPEVGSRLPGLPLLPPLDPDRERIRLFEGIARSLEGIAQPRPTLLILEDLQWAGAATCAFIEFLTHRTPRHALLIVGTYREEDTPRSHPLSDMRRKLRAANGSGTSAALGHLAVGRIAKAAVNSLVAKVSGMGSDANDLAERLYEESEGNPFFLAELIRDLLESGGVRVADGRWEVNPAVRNVTPSSIQEIVLIRVARLSQAARALVELAAVVGPVFEVELLRQAGGWSEDQVFQAVGELLDRQLVKDVGARQGVDYTFTHHLIQQTIYSNVPAVTQHRRHRRVAELMELLYPDRLDDLSRELAHHFDRGGQPDRAATYFIRAIRRALAVYADDDALEYLTRALILNLDSRTRYELLALRATMNHRRGARELQRSDLGELERIANELGDSDFVCDVLNRRIQLQRELGERAEEIELIGRLRSRAVASNSRSWQVEALRAEAAHLVLLSQYDAARPVLKAALAQYQELQNWEGEVECYCLLAEAATHEGKLAEARGWLDLAKTRSVSDTNQSLVVRTLRTAARAAFIQQDFSVAAELGRQQLELAVAIGDQEGEADARSRLALVAGRLFHITEAREQYARAASLYAAIGNRVGQAATLLNSGVLACHLGRFGEARELYQVADALFGSLHDRRGQATTAVNISLAALYQGDYPTAHAAALRGLELSREINHPNTEATALANLGAAELHVGDSTRAIEYMVAGVARRRELGQTVDLASDLCDLTMGYLQVGDLDPARRSAAEMMEIYESLPEEMTYPQYILATAARVSEALGDQVRAQSLWERARITLIERAAAIPDDETRSAFLRLPFHRCLVAGESQT
jgi:predicted ATPase/DNA-binding SARP family transcriptional activator